MSTHQRELDASWQRAIARVTAEQSHANPAMSDSWAKVVAKYNAAHRVPPRTHLRNPNQSE